MRQRSQRGAILVQVLVLVLGLVAITSIVATTQRQTTDILVDRMQTLRADAAAQAGLNEGLATLSSVNTNLVTMNDEWVQAGNQGQQLYELPSATYRYQLIDASSLLDINTVTEETLTQLSLTNEQINSLLDWKDAATSTRSNGADNTFYGQLTSPYQKSSRPLRTLSELFLVNGWTPATLYSLPGELDASPTGPSDIQGNTAGLRTLALRSLLVIDPGSMNTQSNGTQRINVNQQIPTIDGLTQLGLDRQTALNLQRNAPWENFKALFQQTALNTTQALIVLNAFGFTADTRISGKINLNTTTQSVLELLPNMTTELITEIINRQTAGISDIGELATFPNVTSGTLSLIADYFTTGSDTFLVRSLGTAGSKSIALEAIVRITNGVPQIMNIERVPSSLNAPQWWQWSSETSASTEVLGQTL